MDCVHWPLTLFIYVIFYFSTLISLFLLATVCLYVCMCMSVCICCWCQLTSFLDCVHCPLTLCISVIFYFSTLMSLFLLATVCLYVCMSLCMSVSISVVDVNWHHFGLHTLTPNTLHFCNILFQHSYEFVPFGYCMSVCLYVSMSVC